MSTDDPRTPRPGPQDHPPSLDDVASALVDGALDPVQASAARRRPDVAARAGEMEAVRSALGPVPPADDAARERAVAAALAAFDAENGTARTRTDPTPDGRRRRARRRGARLGADGRVGPDRRVIGAAAAVLVGLLTVGIVAGSSSEDGSEATRSSAVAPRGSPGDAERAGDRVDAGEGGGAPPPAWAPPRAGAVPFLGEHPTPAAVLDAAERLPGTLGDDAPTPDARGEATVATGSSCGDDPAGTAEGSGPLVGTAALDGLTVEVRRTGRAGSQRLVVLDPSCAVLAERPAP